MTEPSGPALPMFTQKVPAERLRCLGCGYDLSGLNPINACPECGLPTRRSLLGNSLAASDTSWLDKLGRGTSLKLLNIYLWLGGGMAVQLFANTWFGPGLATAVSLATVAVSLWAAILITSPEPVAQRSEDLLTLRRVVRVCAVLPIAGALLSLIGLRHGPAWLSTLGMLLGVTKLVQYFGEFIYFRRFALRIPDHHLASNTTTVMWGLVASLAVVPLGALIASWIAAKGSAGPVLPTAPIGGVVSGSTALNCAGLAAYVVFGVWYIYLLEQYREAFREAAAMSQDLARGATGEQP